MSASSEHNGRPDRGEDIPASFFESAGDDVVATILCRGPWDPGTAHGGPIAALIGRQVEIFDADDAMVTARLTIELVRPVPLGRLTLVPTVLRPGKRVRLIGISVVAEGVEVTRAVAVRILRTPIDVGSSRPDSQIHVDLPADCAGAAGLAPERVGIIDGVELRSAHGSAVEPGPAFYWFRVHRPLVDDEPITPLTRALIAADFGNGIGSVLRIDRHLFINPEVTVHLWRLPEGEWVGNDARTWLEPNGASIAEGLLTDTVAPIGRAMQSLFVASR